jgi:hypothetical protein
VIDVRYKLCKDRLVEHEKLEACNAHRRKAVPAKAARELSILRREIA